MIDTMNGKSITGRLTTAAALPIMMIDKSPLRAESAPYGVPALETQG